MPSDESGSAKPDDLYEETAKRILNAVRSIDPALPEGVAAFAIAKIIETSGFKQPAENVYEQPAIDPDAPRAYTEEETIEMIVKGFVDNARYWATIPNGGTMEERCQGVAFSNLVLLDGCGAEAPPMRLFVTATDDYVEDCKENGENWHDPDTVIDVMLHDEFYPVMRKYYGEDAPGVVGKSMHPDQMREKLSEAIYNIADYNGASSADKMEACHNTARNIVALLDGENSTQLPPFMLLPAPSRAFDQQCADAGLPLWHTSMPINRKAPQYGVEDSLLDAYDVYRNRRAQAGRDLFK